jgi:hypothetical protein
MRKFFVYLTVIVAYSLLSVNVSFAQSFWLGAKGGISIPNLSSGGSNNNPLNTGYSSRVGPNFAISGEYQVSKLFSVEAMIEYSSQGGKKKGLQAFPSGMEEPPYFYADFKSEAKLNYLMLPVLAKFGFDLGDHSPLRLYVDAGPFVGLLLSAKQVTSGSSLIYADAGGTQPISEQQQSFDSKNDIKDELHKGNFGIEGNLGLAYTLGHNNRIFIEGGGNYGFLNIQKGEANGKNQAGAGTVRVGYAYGFGK